MPITKIPIVHKFGIISHTQRLELQERLLKQSYIQTLKSQKVLIPTRNPLEVTEDFVQQYNNAKDLDEKEQFEETAHKMLERAKRRTGIKDGGKGKHVNLPMAWTELAQLAQCRGKIQEECLDVLIISLDQSPLEKYHIPALFFLAETMLYWLRTDAVHQPYLRTGEIKLLKMGQLVFTRLFYHHMAGQLSGQKDFKNRLFTYLDGLQECQEAYSPYPNALLSLRFIITVGRIIMSDTQLEPGEIKEGDNVRKSALSRPSAKSTDTGKHSMSLKDMTSHTSHSVAISSSVHDLSPTLWHALDVWRCTNHLSGGLDEALKALSHCGMGLVNESWVDSMIALQILSEAAKSSMMVMNTMQNLARGYRPRDKSEATPVSSRSETSGQKAKRHTESYSTGMSSEDSSPMKGRESRASVASTKPTLSDIYERSEEGESDKKGEHSNQSTRSGSTRENKGEDPSIKLGTTPRSDLATSLAPTSDEQQEDEEEQREKSLREPSLGKREVSFHGATATKDERETESPLKSNATPKSIPRGNTQGSRATATTADSFMPPGTGYQAEAGTVLNSGRASEASTVQTYTNNVNTDTPGINGWHWEVAITYTESLCDICLHGSTAEIQRVALMGSNRDIADPFKRGFMSVPLVSAGLLDLAFFKAMNEAKDGGPNDWSWRIRFGAVQSMVKICRCLANDKNREGIRTAAWNVLLRAHSMEKDERVLEALKVGQVHTDIEGLLNRQLMMNPLTLGSKIAAGLSTIYLPPLPPPVDSFLPSKRKEKDISSYIPSPLKATTTSGESMPEQKQTQQQQRKARTTLKHEDQDEGAPVGALTSWSTLIAILQHQEEEIMLATALYEPAVDFNTRNSFDLRRIVEDQWRKELQQQMEEEEAERQKNLVAKQEEDELLQRAVAQKRDQKFNRGKTTSTSTVKAV